MKEPIEGEAPPTPPPAASIERIERLHWGILGAAVLVALAIPEASPLSIAAGGAFMGFNVNLMKRLLQRLSQAAAPQSPGSAIALLGLKTLLFLALLALLFWRVPIDGLSFAVGATMFLVAAVVGSLFPARSTQGES